MASRDIGPGQNFQEAIVRALSGARVMVLIFSSHANESDEVKKELALASQNRVTIVPARVEDVIPTEAFKYELATRQWIDIFADWEQAVGRLAEHVRAILDGSPVAAPAAAPPRRKPVSRALLGGIAALVVIAAAAGTWALSGSAPVVTGHWVSGELVNPYGSDKYTLDFDLTQDGQALRGTVTERLVGGGSDRKGIRDGHVNGNRLNFHTEGEVTDGSGTHPYKQNYDGTIQGDRLSLTRQNDVATGGEPETVTATRR